MSTPTCPICQSKETQIFQDAGDMYAAHQCQACTFVFIHPQPRPDDLVEHYHQEEYYREWIDHQMPTRIKMWQRRLEDLKKHAQDGKLLDVGCGIGTFLNLARASGFEVQGTEVSEFACSFIGKEYGIDVLKGYLEDAAFAESSFDVVTIWHVLEHVPNPKELLREIHRILKVGGLIVVAVPNVENYVMQFFYRLMRGKKLKLFDIQDKELHLSHFSEKTLRKLLSESGFTPMAAGLDLAQVQPGKKMVDSLARVCSFVTRKNLGNALKVYARKEA